MQKAQAQNIVRETLQNDFNKERFLYFVKNLLNKVDDSKAFHAHGYVPEAYKRYIKTYERLATYTDPAGSRIDILVVYLQRETTLGRARTAQRNIIARYLKDRNQKDAGLVAFVSPNLADWRFSLVKMEYKFEESKNGKVKIKEEFTPAKRWSFLVGKHENSHTAQSRLAPIVEDDQTNPTLKNLENAFNIETVTREFFEKYRDLFLRTKESIDELVKNDKKLNNDFREKFVNTADFSKKLLGQIVFLYFLQKKGWFGVEQGKDWGTGSKSFMRDLFEGKVISYKNFFNDVLEPLFYDALARDRSDIDHFNPHFDCKIPFLNGGLFDPINGYSWEKTEINLPNDLFSNDYLTKEKDKGTGILDIFDRYNFTVKEDEPLEKEVAIDPEMLGKVFENLLEVKDRKSKGTYYTPREIVNYMCQQSLLNYLITETKIDKDKIQKLVLMQNIPTNEEMQYRLDRLDIEEIEKAAEKAIFINNREAIELDKALETIKVVDPACGSGAFLVSMMNEIARIRLYLHMWFLSSKTNEISELKRQIIEKNIYGVDIESSAVEIAKLRLWLSLVVDEDDIEQIKPLPNLDYKIMQGNSLLEEFEGIKLFDEKLLQSPIITADLFDPVNELISKLQSQLLKFYGTNPKWIQKGEHKDKPREVIELEARLREVLKQNKKIRENSTEQKDLFADMAKSRHIRDELEQLHKQYFGEANKKNKDEIKRQIEKLEWELIEITLKEQNKISALKKLEEFKRSNTRPFFLWKLNFTEVFQENGGFSVVIGNPPYVGEKGHKEMFREIKNGGLSKFYQGKMDLFYFFFHLAFNIGNKNSQISFITTNYYLTASGARKLRQDFKQRAIIQSLVNFNELKIFESALGQHDMITILQKSQDENAIAKTCITQRQGVAKPEILQQILVRNDLKTLYYQVRQKDLYDGEECYIRLAGNSEASESPIQMILDKLRKQGELLGVICNVNNGIFAGADTLNEGKKKKYKIVNANVGNGIFVLKKDEVDNLNLNDSEKSIIRPLFKNSDIYKYFTNNKNDLFIINLRYTDRPNIDDYPNIKKHLTKFKALLSDRPRTGTLESAFKNGYWYVMSTSRKLNFDSSKIVFPQRSNTNTFGYNEVIWYAMSDVFFITQKEEYNKIDLKYILALLNSKLYYLWLYHKGKRKGEILELTGNPVSEIPIKKVSESEQKPFIEIVDKILAITKTGDYLENPTRKEEVKKYEAQIDQMVYKLYGLTSDDINIIETNS